MEERKSPQDRRREEIIAAFDREREQARELKRQYDEHVKNTRRNDSLMGVGSDDSPTR